MDWSSVQTKDMGGIVRVDTIVGGENVLKLTSLKAKKVLDMQSDNIGNKWKDVDLETPGQGFLKLTFFANSASQKTLLPAVA